MGPAEGLSPTMFRSVLVGEISINRRNGIRIFIALWVALLCAPVYGTVFNWPTAGWTAGTPAPGQTLSQSFTSVNPNDINVSINNNGAGPGGGQWVAGYPLIDSNSSTSETGGFTGVNGLQFYMNSQSSVTSYIRTTVTFATPVINLSFQIWDVDAVHDQFADKISNIQALAQGGGIVGPNSVTSAVPGYNTITGTGLSTVVLGTATASDTSNQGTINITFNGPITQFSFDWSNNDPKLMSQAIAIGPLTYTEVPERSTGWVVSLLCLVAVVAMPKISQRRTSDHPKHSGSLPRISTDC
jgi:hypothetical protein